MIESQNINRSRLVLVVDDYEINRDALGIILEDDYEVLYAVNGQECLDLMHQHAKELSIVLLDLIMPVLDGFEVLEAVARDDELRHIPIIVLTAEKDAELEALELGAADFVAKPFDTPEVILARVGRIIELSEGRQLISAAERDKLTGLYNRNFFFEYADRLLSHHDEQHMDAIVMNIEQFHSVNDLNGRDFGDLVLATIGSEIRAFLSTTEGIASRFEADRFDILCTPQDSYAQVLSRIQNKVNEVSPNVAIHLRMGVYPWREGVEPILMFDRARAACNMVRGNYQRPLKIYNDAMHHRELLNQRLLNDLRPSLERHDFKVYYQPKYSVQETPYRLSSAEALVRWIHPELGMISPADFIPLLEGHGLIALVDNYVWEEAARQVADWRGRYNFTLPVSVNLSRADTFGRDLETHFLDLVRRHGLTTNDLKPEVTESAYTDNTSQLIDVIDTLRTHGFQVEMDDFGSGYSSLNMLSDMPFDVLKMDMRFVKNIEENETDLRLVKLILDIASYLEVTVVAEGVETKGQLDLLQEGGCDVVQGYYFSRPLPPEEFEKLIQQELAIQREGR